MNTAVDPVLQLVEAPIHASFRASDLRQDVLCLLHLLKKQWDLIPWPADAILFLGVGRIHVSPDILHIAALSPGV